MGGVKDKVFACGRANGKKEAGQKAAEVALANEKMIKMYTEKKRLFRGADGARESCVGEAWKHVKAIMFGMLSGH